MGFRGSPYGKQMFNCRKMHTASEGDYGKVLIAGEIVQNVGMLGKFTIHDAF